MDAPRQPPDPRSPDQPDPRRAPRQDRDQHSRRLEQRQALILSAAGEGIYGLDQDGLTTFVNPAAGRMLGWSPEELLGRSMHELFHHSHADGRPMSAERCSIYAAFKDGKERSVQGEVFWRRDGSSFPVEYTSTPIWEDGRPIGAVVVFRDVTERLRAQRALQEALEELRALKDRLQAEKEYLEEEIRSESGFSEILGSSAAIQATLSAVATVAPTEAPVLISGETGTGKELIARAVHEHSKRRERALIKVNCASIPRDLFESEFFGHVRGAFTGAIKDRVGRFELADGGTIFLDEVGEIPLDMQSKLLRVLQEGEFERVGGQRTRKVDVRVIAATNRDLRAQIEAGRFREDLYYRLSVFPVEVAPLRRRPSDIPLLAQHFAQRQCRQMNCTGVGPVDPAQIAALQAYDWPGNVRELQNVIHRAVITARDGKMRFTLADPAPTEEATAGEAQGPEGVLTDAAVQDLARRNLIRALQQAEGKIYGPGSASELLGIKPTTLATRMKRDGIRRSQVIEHRPGKPRSRRGTR